jgi:hypothetical protein
VLVTLPHLSRSGGAIIVLNQLLIPKDRIVYYTAKEVAGFYKGISVDDT